MSPATNRTRPAATAGAMPAGADGVAAEHRDAPAGGGERQRQLPVPAAHVEHRRAAWRAEQVADRALLRLEHPGADGSGEAGGVAFGGGLDVRRLPHATSLPVRRR